MRRTASRQAMVVRPPSFSPRTSTRATPAPPASRRSARGREGEGKAIVVSYAYAASSTRPGGRSATPCDMIVRAKSTGSPFGPTSGTSKADGIARPYRSVSVRKRLLRADFRSDNNREGGVRRYAASDLQPCRRLRGRRPDRERGDGEERQGSDVRAPREAGGQERDHRLHVHREGPHADQGASGRDDRVEDPDLEPEPRDVRRRPYPPGARRRRRPDRRAAVRGTDSVDQRAPHQAERRGNAECRHDWRGPLRQSERLLRQLPHDRLPGRRDPRTAALADRAEDESAARRPSGGSPRRLAPEPHDRAATDAPAPERSAVH